MKLSRRSFLHSAGLASGILLVDIRVPLHAADGGVTDIIAGWIRIDPDGNFSLLMNATEMGQGAQSGLAQILAEEWSWTGRRCASTSRRSTASTTACGRRIRPAAAARSAACSIACAGRCYRAHDVAPGRRAALGSACRGMRRPQRLRASRHHRAALVCSTCSRRGAVAGTEGRAAEAARRVAADRQAGAAARCALEGTGSATYGIECVGPECCTPRSRSRPYSRARSKASTRRRRCAIAACAAF